jgi:uncharacterized membrane protein
MVQLPKKLNVLVQSFSRGSAIAAGLFFCIMALLVLHRHHSYLPSYTSFDQGIFNQVFWNSSHGRWFQSSLSAMESVSLPVAEVGYHRLGQHFTPALLLWVPIYAIARNSTALLLIAVGIVTAAGLVLYQLARQRLSPRLATLIMVSFYASRAVASPTLGNFQDLCQLPLFMFGLFLALEKRAWLWFWICAVLVLAVREDAGILLFSVGLYLIASRRQMAVGLVTCGVSFGYAIAVTTWVMPLFSADVGERFLVDQFAPYIDGDSTSSLAVLWGMISNPLIVLKQMFTPLGGTLNYVIDQALPLALIPLISPSAWVLMGCPLLILFLRDDPWALSLSMRFALNVVPGFFYGAILWWSAHPNAAKKQWFRQAWIACISLSILFTITANPHRALSFMIPDSVEPWVAVQPWTQWPHAAEINAALREIPPTASVSATNHIVPHLSNRREMLSLPAWQLRTDSDEVVDVDYIVADLHQLAQYEAAFVDDRDRLRQFAPWLEDRMQQNYGITRYQDGVILLQRDQTSDPQLRQQWRDDLQTRWRVEP